MNNTEKLIEIHSKIYECYSDNRRIMWGYLMQFLSGCGFDEEVLYLRTCNFIDPEKVERLNSMPSDLYALNICLDPEQSRYGILTDRILYRKMMEIIYDKMKSGEVFPQLFPYMDELMVRKYGDPGYRPILPCEKGTPSYEIFEMVDRAHWLRKIHLVPQIIYECEKILGL